MIIYLPALGLLWLAAGALTLAAVVDVSQPDRRAGRYEVGWCLDRRLVDYELWRKPRGTSRFDNPPMPDWLAYELAGEHVARWLTTALMPPPAARPTVWARPTLTVLAGERLELPMFDSPRFPDPLLFDETAELEAIPA
jgi:hypothetical protein